MGVFMGNTQSKHMVRSRSLLLLLAALASTLVAAEIADWKRGLDAIVTKLQTNDDASADVDTIVPENRDPFEVADESPSKLAASEVTTMLQQGKDEDACEKLADDLCKTVTDNVQTSNNQIARLQDGSKCQNEGQYEVKKSRQEVNKWETKLKTRTSRATKLASARVNWTYTLNTLTQGQCDQFFQDPAYVKAKQASKNAADLVIKAQSQVTTLTKQWNEHIVRAAEKRTKCECDVRAEYNSAYRAATENADKDAKAYAKCKHMECFLKTGNSEKCMNITFDVPTVNRKKKFAQGVPEKECKGTSSTSIQPVQKNQIVTQDPDACRNADRNAVVPAGCQRVNKYSECISKSTENFYLRCGQFHRATDQGQGPGTDGNTVDGCCWTAAYRGNQTIDAEICQYDAAQNEHVYRGDCLPVVPEPGTTVVPTCYMDGPGTPVVPCPGTPEVPTCYMDGPGTPVVPCSKGTRGTSIQPMQPDPTCYSGNNKWTTAVPCSPETGLAPPCYTEAPPAGSGACYKTGAGPGGGRRERVMCTGCL